MIKNGGKIKLGDEVVKAMQKFADNSNNLRRWWSENQYVVVVHPKDKKDPRWKTLKSLYDEYEKFCDEERSVPRKRHELSGFLRNMEFEEDRNIRHVTGNVQYCIGKLDYDTTAQGELICGTHKS